MFKLSPNKQNGRGENALILLSRSQHLKIKFFCCFLFAQLLKALDSFVVMEREGHIIACAALFPFFKDKCGEIACIAVSPECRGQGQGDKLLGMILKISNFTAYAI